MMRPLSRRDRAHRDGARLPTRARADRDGAHRAARADRTRLPHRARARLPHRHRTRAARARDHAHARRTVAARRLGPRFAVATASWPMRQTPSLNTLARLSALARGVTLQQRNGLNAHGIGSLALG